MCLIKVRKLNFSFEPVPYTRKSVGVTLKFIPIPRRQGFWIRGFLKFLSILIVS